MVPSPHITYASRRRGSLSPGSPTEEPQRPATPCREILPAGGISFSAEPCGWAGSRPARHGASTANLTADSPAFAPSETLVLARLCLTPAAATFFSARSKPPRSCVSHQHSGFKKPSLPAWGLIRRVDTLASPRRSSPCLPTVLQCPARSNGEDLREQLDAQRRELEARAPRARHLLHPLDVHHHARPLRLDGHPPQRPGAPRLLAASRPQVRLDGARLPRAGAGACRFLSGGWG